VKAGGGKPFIYLISDGTLVDDNYASRSAGFIGLVETAASEHIQLVQIREKKLSDRLIFDLASRAVLATAASQTKILVNDRTDIALAAGAHGVHLTSSSINADVVRRSVSDDFLIGVSTHSTGDIMRAADAGADFAVYGPVFSSPGKTQPVGLDGLRLAVGTVTTLPILGLGGIDQTNYHRVLRTGAAGFAAIRFLCDPMNLAKLGRELNL
jgi:thiamine-phosphate pyrophosphorylase